MRAFRIADRRFAIFDGRGNRAALFAGGARLVGGRWNSPGRPVIYAAETFAGAVLEILVHSNLGRVPKSHAVVEITIAEDVQVEAITTETVPRWDAEDQVASRSYGDRWLEERRTAVLLVPSFVTRGRERNVLLNPEHPHFARITTTDPEEVAWDQKLFARKG
ncbi:MAG TPA: RES domain-containing protein [Terriglobales bacterium]|nr:RES domain-containing protein [Terriglobales bacterium]